MQTSQSQAFEFIYGHWSVHNRKLRNVADPVCEEWVEFNAQSEVFPILEGVGHVDRMYVATPSDGEPFEGFTLRLYDPSTQTWRIWWSSTRTPGQLDPPVIGRFVDDHGIFDCEDVVNGHNISVRFEWQADPVEPRWRQSFSYDGGASWKVNWEMTFTREGESHFAS
jgi:hypothetical protein